MESGFISEKNNEPGNGWILVAHKGSSRFEFFKVRHFGALHFVKRPSPDYRQDLVTSESLKKEFYIGYNLNHPLIVRYIRMEGDAVYEEYIDGLSLREMIDAEDNRLRSPAFIEHICRQLLEATAYLHSHGVIHNDIKPENVMISRIGDQLKLVDLGCATAGMWDATEGYTPAYKAPEQGVDNTNIYTDIFLVGKLMDELAPTAGVSRLWSNFIKKATADDIRDRFVSDSEALRSIPKIRNIAVLIGSGVLMLCIVLGVLWFQMRPRLESSVSLVESANPISSALDSVKSDRFSLPRSEDIVKETESEWLDSESGRGESESERRETELERGESESGSKDVKAAIDDELLRFASDIYQRRVFPQCDKRSKYINIADVTDCDIRIKEKKKKSESEILDYAEKLASEYPEYADYCRHQASSMIDTQNRLVEKKVSDNPPKLQPVPSMDPTLYTPHDLVDGEAICFLGELDESPEFPGGDSAMWKWFESHKYYPEKSKRKGVEGHVEMTFVIKKDGTVARASILKGLDEEIDKGVIRMLNSMPKWKPGKKNGENVNCRLQWPLYFELPDD